MPELLSLNIDLQVLASTVENVCQSQMEKGPVAYVRKTSDYSKVRFATTAIRNLFCDVKSEDEVWKTKDAVLYEIELFQNHIAVNCCYRDKGISSVYKKDLALLSKSFASDCKKNYCGKIILQTWSLCQNAMEPENIRTELQIFLSKELLEWENAVFAKLNHNPPYEQVSAMPHENLYPDPGNIEGAKDGTVCEVFHDEYERNPANRRACLAHYGYKCQICGFDFSSFYGPEFACKIEVHHIDPLCRTKSAHEIDPIKDLIPVCSNCHTALHSKKGGRDEVYLPDELREMIKRASKI